MQGGCARSIVGKRAAPPPVAVLLPLGEKGSARPWEGAATQWSLLIYGRQVWATRTPLTPLQGALPGGGSGAARAGRTGKPPG